MLRMSNVSRHRASDTLEWFYNEWHGEHVDLMRAAPGVMRLVRRYVQNRALHDQSLPDPLLPLGAEGWDAMSQLTFNDVESFIASFEDPDYIASVRSHSLSDPSVIVSMLTEAQTLIDGPRAPENVKAVQFYRTNEGVSSHALEEALGEFLNAAQNFSGLVGYVRNKPASNVDPSVFVGSRWEGVPFNLFAAFDEMYFSDRAAMAEFFENPGVCAAMSNIANKFLSTDSFTFVCREIVQIDSLGAAK